MRFIFLKSQDSCTEANPPDHTVEATNNVTNVDEATSSNENSDSLLSNLFEKLFRLNQKLEVQEDDIFRLTLQVYWVQKLWVLYLLMHHFHDLFIRV